MSVFDPAIFDGDVFDVGEAESVDTIAPQYLIEGFYGIPSITGTYEIPSIQGQWGTA